jgi:hypothetical protein
MAHFKQLKPQLLSQENGILHVGRGQTSDSKDFGVVGEHGGIFSGFVRSHADKTFYLFDSLTSSPYSQDVVNTGDSSFQAANLNLAQLTGTKAVITDSLDNAVVTIDLNGINANAVTGTTSVTGGNVELSSNSIATTNTNGNLTLAPNGSGQVLIQSVPNTATSAATKMYVDSVVAGLDVKASVRAYATDANILSTTVANPNIIAGSDGTKTITAGVNGAIPAASFDDVSLNLGDRVLVNVQGSETNNVYQGDLSNGIYTVTAVGDTSHPWVLTRAPDAATDDDLTSGVFTFVTEGTKYSATGWVLSTADPITVDTTDLRFTQFSSAGVLYANSIGSGTAVYSSQQGEQLNFRSIATSAQSNTTSVLETALSTDLATIDITFDQSKITGTGALASGSIATGFGAIATANAISGSSVAASGTVSGATVETTDATVSLTSKTLTFASGSSIDMGAASATSLVFSSGTDTYATFDTTDKSVTFGQSVIVPTPTASNNATTKGYVDNAITNATININKLDDTLGSYNIYQSTTSSVNGPTLNLRALRYYDVTAGSGTATDGTTIKHNTAVPLEIAKSSNDNDLAFNFDQTFITTVGALASGSITTGFGNINTSNGITGNTIASTTTITVGSNLLFSNSNYFDNKGNFNFGQNVTTSSWNIYDQNATGTPSIFSVAQGGVITGSGHATFGEITTALGSAGTVDLKDAKITFTDSGTGQAEILYKTDLTIGDVGGGATLELTATDATFYLPLKTDTGVNAAFGGGIQYSVADITKDTTVDSTAYIYRVNATSGNITITLPAASDPGSVGRGYRFIRVDSSSNTVTVTPQSTDHLDGIVDNFALQAQYDHAEVICDGVDGWFLF